MDIPIEWRESLGHITAWRRGDLRLFYEYGNWNFEETESISTDTLDFSDLQDAVFRGPNTISISSYIPSHVTLVYKDGQEYSFSRDLDSIDELYDDISNNYMIFFEADSNGPRDYGGIGDVQLTGYGIDEYDTLILQDLCSDTPTLILRSSHDPWNHVLRYTYSPDAIMIIN